MVPLGPLALTLLALLVALAVALLLALLVAAHPTAPQWSVLLHLFW